MTASKLDAISDQPPDFIKESNVEARCIEAFAAVSYFERTHCLALQVPILPVDTFASCDTCVNCCSCSAPLIYSFVVPDGRC